MRHLYLMRHAKAKQPRGDMTDHQRPLRKRGKHQAAVMAPVLQRWQALQGEVYVSTAARTRETFDDIAAQLPDRTLANSVHFDEALYTFDIEALLAWLKALPGEAERVLIIGHNPALVDLARWFDKAAPPSLPTGSVLHVTLPDRPWSSMGQGGAELVGQLSPAEASYPLFKRLAPKQPDHKRDTASHIHAMLEHQYRMIRALEPGVVAGIDPEFLHQYRVNLRRSRAVCESVLAITKVPGLKKRLKRLKRRAQATSDLRDLDVFLEDLDKTQPPLSANTRQGLQQWLEGFQRVEHHTLCQQLSAPEYAEELQGWQRFIASGEFDKALSTLSPKRIHAVLEERIARHDDDLAALSFDASDTALHELRKSLKRIRYLADLMPDISKPFLSELKRRQRLLGDFQDLFTRQVWLDAFCANADNGQRQKQECSQWRAELEKTKHNLRKDALALAPLPKAQK
ncbi:CHAD domain-containing protein [Vreelandella gomseomensis]|uniref:CHAD domain-containing protein n=1 Tax=Vreelandella gomseomensis TaxID=370766 RepID=A0ABU1G995_9GAMM|nr:CHAD domain-containing protein [Halomonas gomseomensis]MDR5874063.1 CHAD domain-containing protein [Halomonas gomseomensis]